ncbi:MAG: hypothetical protein NTZ59_01655, partial [Bacteroidetes bacterium]|nr:hypothetical protein [Bacteroidota bacterium]
MKLLSGVMLFIALAFSSNNLSAQTLWYYTGSGDIKSTSNWTLNSNGTPNGTLSDFTSGGRYFIIQNATSISLSGTWNIGTTNFASAGGDSLIIGNPSTPAAPITFTLLSGSALTVNKSQIISVSVPSSGNHKIIYQNSGTALSFGLINDPNLEIVYDGCNITSNSTRSFGDMSLINNAVVDMGGANGKYRNITVNVGCTLAGPIGASSNYFGIRSGGVVTINGTFRAGRQGGLATTTSTSIAPVTTTTTGANSTATNASAATAASTTGLTRTVTCASTSNLQVGDIITAVSGGAFPAGTFVRSITSATVFVASAAATTQLSAATISIARYTLPLSSSLGMAVGGTLTKNSGTGVFAASTTITGVLSGGTSIAISAAPTTAFASGASITASSGSPLTTWSTLVFEDFVPNLILGSNSTIDFYRGASGQTAAQTIDTLTYANIAFSNSGAASNKTFLAGTYNISGNLTISNLLGTGTVSFLSNTYNVSGNLTVNNTSSVAINFATSTINLNGSSAQTVAGLSYYNLTCSGATKNTSGNVTVTNVLTLTSGTITTGNDTVIVTPNTISSIVRTSGWVNGNLRRSISSTTARPYPIGDATNYTPITLTFANTPTTTGSVTASTRTPITNVANYSTAPISNSAYVNRFWSLNTVNSSFAFSGTYSLDMTYVNGDIVGGATSSSLITAQNVSGTWSKPSTSGVANVSTATGLTSIGNFVLANDCITVTPSVSISGTTLFCTGTSNTYTATPTNGGSAPTYQWRKNGNSINGATNATLTLTTADVANNDVISCVMTANNVCQTTATATSNNLTVTVSTTITPSVSISGTTLFCTGTSNTYTATPTNGGNAPTYQWRKNGNNISGATNSTLTLTNADVANNDVITCVLTANNLCQTSATANSNSLTVTVATTLTPSVSINSTTVTFCTGTTGTFTATPTNGGSSPTYQWKKNGNNISGATNSTLNLATTDVANNDVITCVLTANNVCQTSATATSNSLTLTVGGTVTPSVSISTGLTTICSNDVAIFTALGTNTGTSPVYQWKKNGSNVATGSSITFPSNTLSNGDVISCVLSANNPCQTTATATSNTITMTVNQSPAAPTILSRFGNNTTTFAVCSLGTIESLYPSMKNGIWSSSNPSVATVANGGSTTSTSNVTAVSNGTANIVYT